MSVSICMAVHNGAPFIGEQLRSILPYLDNNDELILSDDGSEDNTLDIVKQANDPRIKVYADRKFGYPSGNFEYALSHCNNELIFLADQDDVWYPQKISVMTKELASSDLVVCDCRLVDQGGVALLDSFFLENSSQPGLIKNLLRNSFVGCCMAFHRKLLSKVLPFPAGITMHDQWIGLIAMRHFSVKFIPQILVDHRRHNDNYTSTGSRSKNSWNKKVISRLQLAKAIWQH